MFLVIYCGVFINIRTIPLLYWLRGRVHLDRSPVHHRTTQRQATIHTPRDCCTPKASDQSVQSDRRGGAFKQQAFIIIHLYIGSLFHHGSHSGQPSVCCIGPSGSIMSGETGEFHWLIQELRFDDVWFQRYFRLDHF